jgi:V/A-type H+-transporting ATPase subunit I
MIVGMKKIAIIMQQKDTREGIKALRSLGIVHVENQQSPAGKDLSLLRDDYSFVTQALEIISEEEFAEECKPEDVNKALSDWRFTAKHIIDLWKRLDHLEEYSKILTQQIEEWRVWRDFDPQEILRLAENNIYVKLYKIPQKDFAKFPKDLVIERISVRQRMVYCAVISLEKIDTGFKELELPRLSLDTMQKRLFEDTEIIEQIRWDLNKCLCYQEGLNKIKNSLEKEIEFYEALNGMAEVSTLSYLIGYAPAIKEGQLQNLAKKEKWGIYITEPAEADNVPTLLRNPKWVSLINPVFKLMEVVPGYRELDVSPLFLLFLALFFGMIIGDAGYGAIYFSLTLLAQRKYGSKVKDKNAFFLFYLFSSCAIIWGLLTGTVFGQQWYLSKGFKALAPMANNTKFLMAFCLLLGALQLSLAHAWQALRKWPALTALADIGFICLLWVGFLLAKMFILGDAFPSLGMWLLWTGVTLIILFASPHKSFLKTIGAGLGTLALGLTGNFGDVVSYIRLFAVGLAGVAVADSVNALAAGAGGNIIARALILFVGHSINIMLGPVSVLVHGIRLNVLEFSLLHANVTWSGLAYKPLKE